LTTFGDPYLELGKEIAKSRRRNIFNFKPKQHAMRIINLT